MSSLRPRATDDGFAFGSGNYANKKGCRNKGGCGNRGLRATQCDLGVCVLDQPYRRRTSFTERDTAIGALYYRGWTAMEISAASKGKVPERTVYRVLQAIRRAG